MGRILPFVRFAIPLVVGFAASCGGGNPSDEDEDEDSSGGDGGSTGGSLVGGGSGVAGSSGAAQGGSSGAAQGGSSGSSQGGAGGTVGPSPNGPRILSLSATPPAISGYEDDIDSKVFQITALLTDPDGLPDLVGGELKNADGTYSYGVFQSTTAMQGSYTFALSLDDLNRPTPISNTGGSARVTLLAQFYDQAANMASSTVQVEVTCEEQMCGGFCVDTQTNDLHCGTCDNACPNAGGQDGSICVFGQCDYMGTARPSAPITTMNRTCDAACMAAGTSCAEKRCENLYTAYANNDSTGMGLLLTALCSDDLTVRLSQYPSIRCCCWESM